MPSRASTPKDYIRLAAPEPEVLKVIGQASIRRGTSKLSSGQIDRIINQARADKRLIAPHIQP